MAEARSAPYGSWSTPLSPAVVAKMGMGAHGQISELRISMGRLYWLERRPAEGGRQALIRLSEQGSPEEILPPSYNVRTRVHEYGGGAYSVSGETLYFVNFEDQRMYRQGKTGRPVAVTPEPDTVSGLRYADLSLAEDGKRIFCVRERHAADGYVVNEIVSLAPDASQEARVLASGRDFYASPRPSPDGHKLAWLAWDHPRMPWDGCELWSADLVPGGGLENPVRVAGGPEESVFQPEWGPDGKLYFISDRSGWWNLYQSDGSDVRALAPTNADFGVPQWVFGFSRYAFLSDGRIACIYTEKGIDRLGLIRIAEPGVHPLDVGYTSFSPSHLISDGMQRLWFVGARADAPPQVAGADLQTGRVEVLRKTEAFEIPAAWISFPEAIEFPTQEKESAHAFFYRPRNPDHVPPAGELPPLLVLSHGGPTSAARPHLQAEIQFWTSRGFAVVDVNYRGSSGFGRNYRNALRGTWGVNDTHDCVQAARFLAAQGLVDGRRMAIRGGSAGGYTTLCALTFHDVFAAGASYFGLADLESFVHDTHKFEAHYLESLIGAYPEAIDRYRARSPARFADRLSAPLIIFQGLEDKVVPPSQAEVMIRAMHGKGIPYAYVAFPNEGHGFRRAENIQRCLEAELYFYSKVFGFDVADEIPPIEIVNQEAIGPKR